jgi:hypothetical protein
MKTYCIEADSENYMQVPELIAAYMQTEALDFGTAIIARAILARQRDLGVRE